MEEVAPVAAAAAVSVRKPHVSLATPVVPKREPASERELEDHFAAAFAQELDMGVSRAMESGERRQQPAAAVPQRKVQQQQPLPQPMARQDEDFEFEASGGDAQDWQPEDWDDQFARDPGHDGDHADLGIAAMVPHTGIRSRGFKLAAGALGVALLVSGGAIAIAFTGGGSEVASGEPKIVKADTTPVKVKPENPGGLEIANQDQVVYDKVAGSKGVGTQEKLVSSSEEPISIANVSEEDQAAAGEEQMASAADGGDMPVDEAAAMPGDAKADARLAPVADEVSPTLPALAPRRVKTMLIKPDGTVVPAAEQTASVEPAALAPETVASEAAKPIEAAATQAAAAVEANAAPAAADNTQVASTQPASNAAITGEWAVQLASQRSAEDAQATFQNLKSKFPSVLGDKPLAVQRADVEGKGVFYRVRVPAQTKEEAVALCEQLKAAGGSCFIAR
jgi:SPOR domain